MGKVTLIKKNVFFSRDYIFIINNLFLIINYPDCLTDFANYMWTGVGRQGKTVGKRWREYRNALQCGKGVYVSMKMKYIFACGLDIFIDYLDSIVCIAVGRVEALFCHDFWPLLGYGKSGKKSINYQCFNRTKIDKSGKIQ